MNDEALAHWRLSRRKQTNKVKLSLTGLGRPLGLHEMEAATFQDSRRMKVVRLLAGRTGRIYPQEISLVLISVG